MPTANGWRRVPISDVYEGLFDGPHATPAPADEGPVFLGIKNITEDGRLDFSEIRHISEAEYPRWTKRVEPQPGDIVFTYEATLNRYAIIPEGFRGCLGRRTALIRPDPAKIDTRFLFYYFFSPEWRGTIAQNMLIGSTVDRIPLTKFPEFPIALPPLDVQRQIADVLSAYDDVIENNTRRIAILEEMARAIYREWFVNYRFPGHEQVEMVESELGPVPAGWKVLPFSAIADFINGFAFKPAHFEESGKPIVKIAELKNGITSKTPFNGGDEIAEKFHISNGDVLFSWSADLDVYTWPHGEALLNQHLFNVIPAEGFSRLFLFFSLKDRMHEFRMRSQGTTMRHIKRSALSEVKVVIPPAEFRNAFDEHVRPLSSMVINLTSRNRSLRTARDLLLPRLVSGEVDVAAVEDELAGAAA